MQEDDDDMDAKVQELINQVKEENKKKEEKKIQERQDIYQKLLQIMILITISIK